MAFAVASAAAVAAALVLYRHDPTAAHFYPPCVFHQLTGLQCPGCGATRALYALLHGNVARAFWFNPLFLFYLPVLILGGWSELQGRPVRLKPWIGWSVAITFSTFWIVRNLPIYPLYK